MHTHTHTYLRLPTHPPSPASTFHPPPFPLFLNSPTPHSTCELSCDKRAADVPCKQVKGEGGGKGPNPTTTATQQQPAPWIFRAHSDTPLFCYYRIHLSLSLSLSLTPSPRSLAHTHTHPPPFPPNAKPENTLQNLFAAAAFSCFPIPSLPPPFSLSLFLLPRRLLTKKREKNAQKLCFEQLDQKKTNKQKQQKKTTTHTQQHGSFLGMKQTQKCKGLWEGGGGDEGEGESGRCDTRVSPEQRVRHPPPPVETSEGPNTAPPNFLPPPLSFFTTPPFPHACDAPSTSHPHPICSFAFFLLFFFYICVQRTSPFVSPHPNIPPTTPSFPLLSTPLGQTKSHFLSKNPHRPSPPRSRVAPLLCDTAERPQIDLQGTLRTKHPHTTHIHHTTQHSQSVLLCSVPYPFAFF